MSAFRDLVVGQGCAPDANPSGSNPLAKLVFRLLDSTQKHEQLAHLPDLQVTSTERQKIASRASVVTRHVFPDASKEFQEQQVQSFLRSLDGGEGPSWQDDRKYDQFFRPPLAQGPSPHQACADEFGGRHVTCPAPLPHPMAPAAPSSQWAHEYAGRVSSAQSSAWAEEYQAGPSQPSMASLSLRDSSHAPTPWVAEYLGARGPARQLPDSSRAARGSQWAEHFSEARPKSEQWAEEFASSSAQQAQSSLIPEQRKAMQGPSADDPLEDDNATSWVHQYNEELARPSVNALESDMKDLEARCGLAPAEDNPYSAHPMPLQIAQQMDQQGRVRGASLAYEAAARVAPLNREVWWRLGRCRLELEDFRGACGPLTHALKGWPTHPGNTAVWTALVQATLAAGKKEAASEALQGWLRSDGSRGDAALALGSGGVARTTDLEQELNRRTERAAGDVRAWEMLGYLHTLRGDHAAATEAFGKAVVMGAGQDDNALCLLGGSLAAQKLHAQAERAFRAAAASSEGARACAGLARSQSAQGKFEEAVQSYSRALERRPDATSLWDSLAMALTALGHMEGADAAARQDQAVLQQVLRSAG